MDRLTPAFYKLLLDQLYDAVYVVDRQRRIIYWNAAAERLTGFRAQEVLGRACSDGVLMHLDSQGTRLCDNDCPATRCIDEGCEREAHVFFRHKLGHHVPVLTRVSPVRDDSGAIIGAAEVFSSNAALMQERQLIDELKRMALIDPVTEVGNRHYLEQVLVAKLNEFERFGWPLGVLFIDVDHFKQVNDTYGHATGDRVLQLVARTLEGNVRSFDLLGRWGGEEFLALFVNTSQDKLFAVGTKLRLLVGQSALSEAGHELQVTISIGGTLALPADTPATLVARADAIMYRAKREGRDRVIID